MIYVPVPYTIIITAKNKKSEKFAGYKHVLNKPKNQKRT